MHTVYLSLGSNIGNRKANLEEAIRKIGEMIGNIERQSSFLTTEPWGFQSPNLFLNAAVKVITGLSPTEVLEAGKRIEREMGRMKKSANGKYHDRIIDIDILMYDDLNINTSELTIPHPHMHERDFVMIPLREIMDNC